MFCFNKSKVFFNKNQKKNTKKSKLLQQLTKVEKHYIFLKIFFIQSLYLIHIAVAVIHACTDYTHF